MLSHFSHVQLCMILWTKACHAPLSMGFSRQEFWSGSPPGDRTHVSYISCMAGGFLTTSAAWEAPQDHSIAQYSHFKHQFQKGKSTTSVVIEVCSSETISGRIVYFTFFFLYNRLYFSQQFYIYIKAEMTVQTVSIYCVPRLSYYKHLVLYDTSVAINSN